ncbi:PRTRC system protein E (plasmid) [Cupriavidus basilensis]
MPLVLTATAAELDAGFIEALASFTASRRSLAEQVEATAAVLAAAKSTQTQKASKALSNAARVQSTAGVSAEDDDEDLEAGGSTVENIDAGTSSATSTAATSATPPAAAGTDLASLL